MDLDSTRNRLLLSVGLIGLFTVGLLTALFSMGGNDISTAGIVRIVSSGQTFTGQLVTTTTPQGETKTVIRYKTRKGETKYISATTSGMTGTITIQGQGVTLTKNHTNTVTYNQVSTVSHNHTSTVTSTQTEIQTVTDTHTVTDVQTVTEIQTVTVTVSLPVGTGL